MMKRTRLTQDRHTILPAVKKVQLEISVLGKIPSFYLPINRNIGCRYFRFINIGNDKYHRYGILLTGR